MASGNFAGFGDFSFASQINPMPFGLYRRGGGWDSIIFTLNMCSNFRKKNTSYTFVSSMTVLRQATEHVMNYRSRVSLRRRIIGPKALSCRGGGPLTCIDITGNACNHLPADNLLKITS